MIYRTYTRHLVICSGLNHGKVRPARLLAQTYTIQAFSYRPVLGDGPASRRRFLEEIQQAIPLSKGMATYQLVQRPTQKGT